MDSKLLQLRDETGAGVMDCKRALDDAGGDLAKAKELLIERGGAKASSKSERKTGAGYLETYVHGGRIGVMLELRCETDFVAKNEKFRELAHEIAMQIASMNPQSVEELLAQEYIKDPSKSIQDLLTQTIAVTGENMKVERFTRYEV
jgi:elongation factor Ts